jgi:hypothetical protein
VTVSPVTVSPVTGSSLLPARAIDRVIASDGSPSR